MDQKSNDTQNKTDAEQQNKEEDNTPSEQDKKETSEKIAPPPQIMEDIFKGKIPKREDKPQLEKKEEQPSEKQDEEKPKIQVIPKEKISLKPLFKSPIVFIKKIYEDHYKLLLLIPLLLFVLAVIQISVQNITTGDFINKGISLKGGLSVTIPTNQIVQTNQLQERLSAEFTENDINVRLIEQFGSQTGIVVEADLDPNNQAEFSAFIDSISANLGVTLEDDDYSIEFFGSVLSESFFRQTIKAMIIAFVFMGIVVFIYFRSFIPSLAVILASFSDIIVTIAIINLLGVKISTAGIAAFLMLIGYSVDTDILLSTRVLKRTEGTTMERVYGAMKTGMMMTVTTLVAITIAFIFSQSEVLHQILLVIIIGLLIDIINTWIQNAGILRWYIEHKAKIK